MCKHKPYRSLYLNFNYIYTTIVLTERATPVMDFTGLALSLLPRFYPCYLLYYIAYEFIYRYRRPAQCRQIYPV